MRTLFSKLFIGALVFTAVSCGQNNDKPAVSEKEPDKNEVQVVLKDYGKQPVVLDIEAYTLANENFRTALWTGTYLQLTLMSIPAGGEIGLEVHHDIDQFIRVEEGKGRVMMGDAKTNFNIVQDIGEDFIVLIPAGKWHNIVNTGNKPLKLYSIYTPVEHPFGTIHKTKAEAEAAEGHH